MAGLQNIHPRRWAFTADMPLAAIAREAQQFANHVSTTLRLLSALAILDGKRVTSLAFVAGTPLRIQHGLTRVPRGWIVTRFVAASAGSVRESSANPPDASQLTLECDVDAIVDLVVL